MNLRLFLTPILVLSIFLFVVGASPSADDEAHMLEEMMDQLAQEAAPARHERSSEFFGGGRRGFGGIFGRGGIFGGGRPRRPWWRG